MYITMILVNFPRLTPENFKTKKIFKIKGMISFYVLLRYESGFSVLRVLILHIQNRNGA